MIVGEDPIVSPAPERPEDFFERIFISETQHTFQYNTFFFSQLKFFPLMETVPVTAWFRLRLQFIANLLHLLLTWAVKTLVLVIMKLENNVGKKKKKEEGNEAH